MPAKGEPEEHVAAAGACKLLPHLALGIVPTRLAVSALGKDTADSALAGPGPNTATATHYLLEEDFILRAITLHLGAGGTVERASLV